MMSPPAPPLSPGEVKTPASPAFQTQEELHIRQLVRDLHVDTGDIVLFDRKCSLMGLYGSAICTGAKLFGRTQWDHNGVIVRVPSLAPPDAQDTEDELFVLEATLTGVKLRPFVARVLLSRGHEVSIRKLQVPRSTELETKAIEFAFRMVNAPYEDNPANILNAGVSIPNRLARDRLFAAFMTTEKELTTLDMELEHRDKMPVFERKALLQERQVVEVKHQTLRTKLQGTDETRLESFHATDDGKSTKMFCSQLVAGMYQHLGLLLPYPSANLYLPKHFSARDGEEFLKLQQGASFLPEISLRQRLETQAKRFAMKAKDVKERAPHSARETAAIVHCLRRHQLFHTLNEVELLQTALQFRRRVLVSGEVAFYQGTPGDCFYIIERGHCDVFVDYDHLVKTQTALHADSTDALDFEHEPKHVLHKRKTRKYKTVSSSVSKSERVHVATKGPGNAFGESALIYDTPRRATIQASLSNAGEDDDDEEEAVVLWQLDKLMFREVLARHPGTQKSLEERRFLLEVLEDHPLFAELDDHAKALAVRECFPLNVRAGTTILRQGDPGDYFYLIESGRCEVSRRKPKAMKPFVDRVIGRGASFGEAALLYNSRRGASVKTLEDAKIWCMDRASFVTITRSGSSALYNIFKKVGTTVVSGLNESFATERDLRRMLTDPQQIRLFRHSANDEDDDTDEAGNVVDDSTSLPSAQAYDRAVQLALSLLLNDSSGLVNFSQFAHFHIALGASNIDQLLPEAAFRVLKLVTDSYDTDSIHTSTSSTTPSLFDQDGPDQSAIKLSGLPRALCQWMSTSTTAEAVSKDQEMTAQMTPGRLAFYESLFDLPAHHFGDQYVTHDDLVRGIAAFEMEDARSESDQIDTSPQSEDFTSAKKEFRAFLAALKADISALRTIWRAAELQAHDKTRTGIFNNQQEFTFHTSVRSGWVSTLRQNPTGSDWEYLQPEMEENNHAMAYNPTETILRRQHLTAQVTSFAAAIAAGVLARTVCAPLERLKILMQLSIPKPRLASVVPDTVKLVSGPAPYTSLTRGLMNMVKLSGPRSLFSGNLAHSIWVVPSVPMKFVLCHIYQEQLGHFFPKSSTAFDAIGVSGSRNAGGMTNLMIGGLAGLTLHCLLYPLDVIRGQLTVQQYYNANRPLNGIVDCAHSIRDKEGLRGLYRGFMPASVGVFTYIGCNFAFYESLRPVFVLYDRDDTSNQFGDPSVPGQILCATTASLASQCISYPFDVIRRRIQLQSANWHPELKFSTYESTWHCIKLSVEEEGGGLRGLRSLYRGLSVNAVKALPSTIISFVSYEKLRKMKHSVDDA